MSKIELRAPRRRTQKEERDQLLPILCTIVAIGIGGFMFLKNADHPEQKGELPEPINQSNTYTPSKNIPPPPPHAPTNQSGPKNRITTESGRTYYVPESTPRYRNDGPTAEDEYRRASEIMESNKPAPSRYASRSDEYHNNTRLRIADQVCKAVFAEGLIAYRHCRAEQWQLLRNGCIARRQQLNMATGERFYSLRAETAEWCEAEAAYHIVG